MLKKLPLICLLLTLLQVTATQAETLEQRGYVIHYSAFNANFLTPEVAKAYKLNRSRYRGLVNIAVQRKMADGSLRAVVATISGYATRLSGSESPVDFQMISEGDAIYYLGEVIIGNNETLRFDLKIKPSPTDNPIKLSFNQVFFTKE